MIGPYREIFLSVLKTSFDLEKYFSIRTSNPVNNIHIYIFLFGCVYERESKSGAKLAPFNWGGGGYLLELLCESR
jgi:hypothetical protein